MARDSSSKETPLVAAASSSQQLSGQRFVVPRSLPELARWLSFSSDQGGLAQASSGADTLKHGPLRDLCSRYGNLIGCWYFWRLRPLSPMSQLLQSSKAASGIGMQCTVLQNSCVTAWPEGRWTPSPFYFPKSGAN